MIINRLRPQRGPLLAVSAVICALGLGACGGFNSASTGNGLIKDWFKKFGRGKVTVKTVSCPDGVKFKVGGSYDCKVVLHATATNRDHPGTITIHMASGNKVQMSGVEDIHVQ